ncbi:MAG: DJ-1 family glyoxalase III [Schaedlerella sp.]|nr:DJ-1 family glyoxalase III [Schaedlerella sp.]
MKDVKVFLADGFEEIEGLTVVDILRRAGMKVETVSVMKDRKITGAHQIVLHADAVFEEADFTECEMLVLPGGMPGTLHLKEHKELADLIVKFNTEGKYVAAICAAPSVLGGLGILEGKKACCYPSFEEALNTEYVVFDPVAHDGNVITGRGMGTAIPFALKLTEILCGKEKADEIGKSIIYA